MTLTVYRNSKNLQMQIIILLQQQMSAWLPRWIWWVVYPNFYEAGVCRACVDFLSRKALKYSNINHDIHVVQPR